MNLTPEQLAERVVEHLDIAYDELSPKHYKEEEDLRFFQSKKTHRGPLVEGWRNNCNPIMCSYKVVKASFEVWGLQTRVEEFLHSVSYTLRLFFVLMLMKLLSYSALKKFCFWDISKLLHGLMNGLI